MMHRTLTIGLVLTFATTLRADEPTFNGRKLSEWQTMLKEDPTPRKRRAAVVALSQIGAASREYYPACLALIGKALRNDASPAVREQAAVIIGQLKIDEVSAGLIPDLTEAMRNEKESVNRKEVATALGRFGKYAKPAVAALTAAVKDPDASVRATATDALGRIGPDARTAGPELLPLFKDADKSVRQAVIFAVGRIDPDDKESVALLLVGVLKSDSNAELRREAVLALGFLGEKSAPIVVALESALSDKDSELRALIALTLGKFGPAIKSAEPGLLRVIQIDPSKDVRLNAIRSLCQGLGELAPNLIPVLAEQLKADPDFEVRVAIAEELGAFGIAGKPAIPALRAAQKDPQVKVREAATQALKKIDKPMPKAKS